MTDGTTQEGVSQEDSAPRRQPVSPRRDLSKMAERRRKSLEEEMGAEIERPDPEPGSQGDQPEPEEPTAAASKPAEEAPEGEADAPEGEDEKPAEAEETKQETAEGERESQEDDPLVTVKVDGQEIQKPLSEVVKGYQQTAAAQARFREANRRLQEAREAEARLQQYQQQFQAPPQGQQQGQQAATGQQEAGADNDEALKIARAIQYGDTNEVAQAIQKIQQANQQGRGDQAATLDPNQIAQQVTQQVREQQAYDHALNTVGQEYQDVFNDPVLTRAAADSVHAIRRHQLASAGYPEQQLTDAQTIAQIYKQEQARGVVPTDLEVFRAAAQHIQQWDQQRRGQPGAQPATQEPQGEPAGQAQEPHKQGDGFETKRARKRGTKPPPQAASGHRGTESSEPDLRAGKSPAEVVAWLRKQRGQQNIA